jgi:hypothetical protein
MRTGRHCEAILRASARTHDGVVALTAAPASPSMFAQHAGIRRLGIAAIAMSLFCGLGAADPLTVPLTAIPRPSSLPRTKPVAQKSTIRPVSPETVGVVPSRWPAQ